MHNHPQSKVEAFRNFHMQSINMKLTLSLVIALTMTVVAYHPAHAQARIPLVGNHPPQLDRFASAGLADPARPLTMALTLKLRNPAALDQLLAAQQDPGSPNYHQWLTPDEFAARFGPAAADLQTAENWLATQGFTVTSADLARRTIAFTGTVAQASQAFDVAILSLAGGDRYGNADDPELPPQIAGMVESLRGLDNLSAAIPLARRSELRPAKTAASNAPPALQLAENTDNTPVAATVVPSQPAPDYYVKGLGGNFFGPTDFQTFYDEAPLLKSGLKGAGPAGCIGIIGDSDYLPRAIGAFDARFHLPPAAIKKYLANNKSPGINNDELETLLDLEWAHAAAPGSPLRYYLGNNTLAGGGANGLLDAISAAVTDNACPVISISYSFCGSSPNFYSSILDTIFKQAAAQGQTTFVAAGDFGAAAIVPNGSGCTVGSVRGVNEMAADPHVTAVGGVGFYPIYDSKGADVGNVPEHVWNDYPRGGASGGGQSAIFAKPSYQTAGTPADGTRDLPDVSLIASPYNPGALTIMDASCVGTSQQCDGRHGLAIVVIGGTSLATPTWAGIARLIAQAAGDRLGSFNPTLYSLAATGQSQVGLRDIVTGNNSFNGVPGFDAGPGFDLASGWGTVDAAVFVAAYASTLPGPATLKAGPPKLAFNNVLVGRTSFPRFVTILNPRTQKSWAIIGAVTAGGAFTAMQNCAGTMIPPGGSCRFAVRFTPAASGPAAPVTLQITDNAGNSPQTVALIGSGRF